MTIYRSENHPGGGSAPVVFARAHIRPIGVCLLPIMILASIGVLTRIDPLRFLAWSVPLAYFVATWWTYFTLTRQTAEIHVGELAARARTVWDVARRRQPGPWAPVLGVKQTGVSLLVSIGYTVMELTPSDWPDYGALHRDLRRAARAGAAYVPDPIELNEEPIPLDEPTPLDPPSA